MRQGPARPQQTEPAIQIINRALRDAATAPTVYDALELAGQVLVRLAEIAPAEVRHA
ncbi:MULTISPECIES: hypothetical protein [Paraburkholderia]|uniref:hypothetical protein n=1 Tax=Paraburkholderia TaxID=1822464 RepID=UPI00036BB8A0|nr:MULTISPECIES: hypothetical protein [Paraburkholderia]MDH6150514.1 hypothetical protein [Paraburkholderia sp. WSM4179]